MSITVKNSDEIEAYPRLAFVVAEPLVSRFFLLLQQGVMIRVRTGCSVEAFLREEIKATPETIEKIQSIVLDGRPVDDIGSAVLHDGSTLALSAAMPGLVGATLRRGGTYSSFRGAITYHESGQACTPGEGWVSIKLFNLLMAELGTGLLQKGVLLSSSDFLGFLAERAHEFRQGCSVTLNGRSIDVGMLGSDAGLGREGKVLLSVSSGPAEA
ncbi:MAG TPA: hypothetical protein VEM40_12685 [Nitrospirota bacterium]|nr:hypothetical protein [Nitrospirota bacterium]